MDRLFITQVIVGRIAAEQISADQVHFPEPELASHFLAEDLGKQAVMNVEIAGAVGFAEAGSITIKPGAVHKEHQFAHTESNPFQSQYMEKLSRPRIPSTKELLRRPAILQSN